MENARRITFFVISYILSAGQSNFILMILLINQWYLESQNSLVILAISKKNRREVFNKENITNICWVEKSKTNEWWENFINNEVPESDWKGNFRVSRKSLYELCSELHPYLLKKQNKKLNVSRSSSGVLY